jgi:hypothetical protein
MGANLLLFRRAAAEVQRAIRPVANDVLRVGAALRFSRDGKDLALRVDSLLDAGGLRGDAAAAARAGVLRREERQEGADQIEPPGGKPQRPDADVGQRAGAA